MLPSGLRSVKKAARPDPALTTAFSQRADRQKLTAPASRMPDVRQNKAYKEALQIIQRAGQRVPGLVVLDLDYTIWPFWAEMYSPRETQMARLFPEAHEVIEACRDSKIPMAVASRSPEPPTARAFLQALGLADGYFEETLVIPYTPKAQTHFPQLRKALGIEYDQMLFFDDEAPNIHSVSRLGVTCVLVSTSAGVCIDTFRQGMEAFASKK